MTREDNTRRKLLEATLELISQKGYNGATTREIASRAGVSEITLFRRFGKKERLFEEMLESFTFIPRLRDLMEEVEDTPLSEGLQKIGSRFLQTLRQRRCLVQVLLSEMSHYPRKVRNIHQQMIDYQARTLKGFLEGRQGRGEIRPFDMDLPAFAFFRILFMTFLHESILREQDMDDDYIEITVNQVVEVFLNGIAAGSEV